MIKKSHVLGQLKTFLITIYKKNHLKIHSYGKKKFGQKNIQSLFKVKPLAHCILFAAPIEYPTNIFI
jgi:hypothetical protein